MSKERARLGYLRRNARKQPRKFMCRLDALNASADDPMNAFAPMDEIYNDARRQDIRDGCPSCTADMIENASEPDVLARWKS